MFRWNARKSYLFVYTVPGRIGFWTRDLDGKYLRLIVTGRQAWVVRIQAALPSGSTGFCAMFETSARKRVERVLHTQGRKARFSHSVSRCEQAEQCYHDDRYVFGLHAPAGQIAWLAGSDPCADTNGEKEKRVRPSF